MTTKLVLFGCSSLILPVHTMVTTLFFDGMKGEILSSTSCTSQDRGILLVIQQAIAVLGFLDIKEYVRNSNQFLSVMHVHIFYTKFCYMDEYDDILAASRDNGVLLYSLCEVLM